MIPFHKLEDSARISAVKLIGIDLDNLAVTIDESVHKHIHEREQVVAQLKRSHSGSFLFAQICITNVDIARRGHVKSDKQHNRCFCV